MRTSIVNSNVVAILYGFQPLFEVKPLTCDQVDGNVTKGLPYATQHYMVDFILSNILNSGIQAIGICNQRNAKSVLDRARFLASRSKKPVRTSLCIVPPVLGCHFKNKFEKSTDDLLVRSMVNFVKQHHPCKVALIRCDSLYLMDMNQMVNQHQMQNADITITAKPLPITDIVGESVVVVNADNRVLDIETHSTQPSSMPYDTSQSLVDVGHYLIDSARFIECVPKLPGGGVSTLGQQLVACHAKDFRVMAYDLSENKIPGVTAFKSNDFWHRITTVDDYFDAHQELLASKVYYHYDNQYWPIPVNEIEIPLGNKLYGFITNTLIGSRISVGHNARIRNSIIRDNVQIDEGVMLDSCIVMDGAHIKKDAQLRRAIVTPDFVVKCNDCIGFDLLSDLRRYYVTPSGVVVVSRAAFDVLLQIPPVQLRNQNVLNSTSGTE